MRFRLLRAVGFLLLYLLIQWVGWHISGALTGPLDATAYVFTQPTDDAAFLAATLVVVGCVERYRRTSVLEWGAASAVYLLLSLYGTPGQPGALLFWWGWSSDLLTVAAAGAVLGGAAVLGRGAI